MNSFFVIAAYILSAVLLPWWITVFLAVILLAYFKAYGVVVFGGILMDLLYGAPQPALFEFQYIYTLVFGILALVSWVLDRMILE